jgi:hypothetical protein
LQVASVKLTLHVLATRTIGGGLSFNVPFIGMAVRLGTKVTKSDTHEIEVNLTPPGQEGGHQVRDAPWTSHSWMPSRRSALWC